MFCSPHPVGMRTRLSRLDNAGPKMSPANVLRVGHCVDFLFAITSQDLLHISRCNPQTPLDLNTAVFLLIIICPDLIIHGLRCYLQNPKSFNNSIGLSVVAVNNNPSTSDYTSSDFGCKNTRKLGTVLFQVWQVWTVWPHLVTHATWCHLSNSHIVSDDMGLNDNLCYYNKLYIHHLPASPSCPTRATPKSLTPNEKCLWISWKNIRRMAH